MTSLSYYHVTLRMLPISCYSCGHQIVTVGHLMEWSLLNIPPGVDEISFTSSYDFDISQYLQLYMVYGHQIRTSGATFREESINHSFHGDAVVDWYWNFDKSLCFQLWIRYSHQIWTADTTFGVGSIH